MRRGQGGGSGLLHRQFGMGVDILVGDFERGQNPGQVGQDGFGACLRLGHGTILKLWGPFSVVKLYRSWRNGVAKERAVRLAPAACLNAGATSSFMEKLPSGASPR